MKFQISKLEQLLFAMLILLGACSPFGKSFFPSKHLDKSSLTIPEEEKQQTYSISIVSGNNQAITASTALPQALKIKLLDAESLIPLANKKINWSLASGSFSFNASSSQTDNDGIASMSGFSGSTAGTSLIKARVEEDTSKEVEFSLRVLDFVDDDNSSYGFGGGEFNNLVWDQTQKSLRMSQAENTLDLLELHSSWTPQWDKLVSYWKFNGNCKDSVSTNDCTTRNGASIVSDGKINGSASFDGVDDAIDVVSPVGIPVGGSARTLCTWAKWVSPYTGGQLVSQNTSAGQHFIMQHGLHLGVYYFFTDGLVGNNQTNSYSLLVRDEWSFECLTLNSNVFSFYINSNLIASNTFGTPINTGPMSTLVFGSRYDMPPSNFKGQLDEISIWSTALSATEIRTIYDRQRYTYSGVFKSRVFDLGDYSSWSGISWKTSFPSFKDLLGDADQSGGITSRDYELSSDYASLVGSNGLTTDDNLQQGLTSLWSFNGNFGTLSDSEVIPDRSGNGWNLTAVDPDATNTISYVSGVIGQGIKLDGANDYLLGSTSFNFTDAMSFSMWVYPEASQVTSATIFSKHSSGTAGFSFEQHTGGDNQYVYGWGNGASWTCSVLLADAVTTKASKWQHIAMTKSGTEMILYLNGAYVKTCTGSWVTIATSVDAFMIGRFSSGGGRFFKGSLDEVAFWNRKLHAKEVLQLYVRGATRLGFQTRTCSKSDCSDADNYTSWKGPAGDTTSFFTERNYNSLLDVFGNPLGQWFTKFPLLYWNNFSSFSLTKNKYFQYRTLFETLDASTECLKESTNAFCSTELKSVEVLR